MVPKSTVSGPQFLFGGPKLDASEIVPCKLWGWEEMKFTHSNVDVRGCCCFFFFLLPPTSTPLICSSCPARDQTLATSVTQTAAVIRLDP